MMPPPDARAAANRLVERCGIVAAARELNVAGLLYTFRCSIGCRHCGFRCSPAQPDVRMTTRQAVAALHALHDVGRVVHVAGGEAMVYWDDLKAALAAAAAEGVAPHFIETNCSFAADDDIARRRLGFLADHGVAGVLLSADPFHQAFVPPERFIRVRAVARETFGDRNVWCTDAPDERIEAFADVARDDGRLRAHVRAHPPVLVGAAYERLREYLDEFPLAEMPLDAGWFRRYRTRDCAVDLARETMWEIHVDCHDNILTNCGVIVGDARRTSPRRVLADGPETANFAAGILCREGPFGLAEFARREHGFRPPDRAHSKCSFCFQVRRFLRRFHPDIIGPAEIYGC